MGEALPPVRPAMGQVADRGRPGTGTGSRESR